MVVSALLTRIHKHFHFGFALSLFTNRQLGPPSGWNQNMNFLHNGAKLILREIHPRMFFLIIQLQFFFFAQRSQMCVFVSTAIVKQSFFTKGESNATSCGSASSPGHVPVGLWEVGARSHSSSPLLETGWQYVRSATNKKVVLKSDVHLCH